MGFYSFYPGLVQKKGETLAPPPPKSPTNKIIEYWNEYQDRNFRLALEEGLYTLYHWDSRQDLLNKKKLLDLNEKIDVKWGRVSTFDILLAFFYK